MRGNIPRIALQLGLLGLSPLFAAALLSLAQNDFLSRLGFIAFAIYGATLASFWSGVRFGAEIMRAPDRPNSYLLLRAVLTPMLGWLLAFYAIVGPHALSVTAAFAGLFALHHVWDMRAAREAGLPAWYPRFRQILTGGVMLACLILPLSDLMHR